MNDAPGSTPRTGMTTAPPAAGSLPPRRAGKSGLVLLIVSGIATIVGFILAVPALVLAILSVVNRDKDPSHAARLARWGWVVYAIVMTVMLAAAGLLFWIAGYAASGNN
jgi:hypothetical protein